MALNFNKVLLGGRLTADPELKTTQSGVSVVSFSLAVDRRGTKGEDKVTDFIDCVAWRERAEFICKYFKKGSALFVEGTLQKRSWQDAQGNKRSTFEVNIDDAKFVESKYDAPTKPTTPPPSAFETVTDEGLPF